MHSRQLDLHIEKLVYGGSGLARSESGVVFVDDVLPGERVRAEITGTRAGTTFARPLEILEPSPLRREPPCPYARSCGGCDWLHLTYEAQVAAKRDIVIDCMRRVGKLKNVPEFEVFTSPEWGYRIRAQFQIHGRRLGFFRRSSDEVIDIDTCPLLTVPLNSLLSRRGDVLDRLSPGAHQLKALSCDGGVAVSSPVIRGMTSERGTISVGGRKCPVTGACFFQSNRFLIDKLAGWAAPWVGGRLLWDLYGGVGLFSMALGEKFAEGLLVESEAVQAHAAGNALREQGLPHIHTRGATVEAFLESITAAVDVDCCIIDPPRPGLSRPAREALSRITPRTIVYVSCNPSTQARDVAALVNSGYMITQAAIFDLYPQTSHIETAMVMQGTKSQIANHKQ